MLRLSWFGLVRVFRNALLNKHMEKVWLHFMGLIIVSLKHIALLILLSACCKALTAFQAATVLWMSEDTHQHHRCFTAPLSTFPLLFSFKQAATWRWMPAPTCTVSYSSHIPVTAISDWLGTPSSHNNKGLETWAMCPGTFLRESGYLSELN